MTIRKDEGTYWAECDACGDCHELDVDDFGEAICEIKDAGWRVLKDGSGDWVHHCKCVEDQRGGGQ